MNSIRQYARKSSTAAIALTMLALLFAGAVRPAQAQIPAPTVLYNFQQSLSDACDPAGPLAQGRDGNLYGVGDDAGNPVCGANGAGAIFKITPGGVESVFFNFPSNFKNCTNGLMLATDGNFYGTCLIGNSATGYGSIFKVTPAGVFTDLYDFTNANGDAYPPYPPIQGVDGNLYGVTGYLGFNAPGSIYKITLAGVYTNLHSFNIREGYSSSLMQGIDANLYGTLPYCSAAGNDGCAFKISVKGVYKVIHPFGGATYYPTTNLVQDAKKKLYGASAGGGTNLAGAIYTMTTAGKVTILYNLATVDDQLSTILQPTDGNFYGVSPNANAGPGLLYEMTAKKAFSTFLFPNSGAYGIQPGTPLVQDTNGFLYGTTSAGGSGGVGTFYSLNIGAKPFARLVATSGIEGTSVGVFGQGFLSATGVTFGGALATFTPAGDGYLTVTVPPNALTGAVVVEIPGGNLTSTATFDVTPTLDKTFSPTSGPVGTVVTITGTGLLQTTKVAFGGVAATEFTVISDTEITATVPTGAKTGTITVTTTGGKVTSKAKFTVT